MARVIFRSERKMKILTFLILGFASAAFAETFEAIDGKEYKNVRVSRVEPDGIVLISKSGIAKVYFTELTKEVQDRFHYDAANAAAYSAQQTASQVAFQNQQAELRRKLAEEKNRYWTGQAPAKNTQDKLQAPAAAVAGRGQQVEVISHGAQVDIVNWKTAVVKQYNIHSVPQVNVYNRGGRLVGTVVGADVDKVKSYVAQAKTGG